MKSILILLQTQISLLIYSITTLPIVVKGILRPDDAELAIHHGCHAIAVSNHGARQLDGVPASVILLYPYNICAILIQYFDAIQIDALPAIVKQVNGRCEVYIN